MKIPRIRAKIRYDNGTELLIDKVYETTAQALTEYQYLAGKQNESVYGNIVAEMCSHFENETEPCELFAPTVTWGNDDEGNPE